MLYCRDGARDEGLQPNEVEIERKRIAGLKDECKEYQRTIKKLQEKYNRQLVVTFEPLKTEVHALHAKCNEKVAELQSCQKNYEVKQNELEQDIMKLNEHQYKMQSKQEEFKSCMNSITELKKTMNFRMGKQELIK